MSKYLDLLSKILAEGREQKNKKGNIKYLLNEKLTLTEQDIMETFESKAIAKKKLEAELELWLKGETSVESYQAVGIRWWDYCYPTLQNTYPTFFKALPELIRKINEKKGNSKTYVFYGGATNIETNQLPCLSLIQFQINDGKLTETVYIRSSDASIGLPSDIFQLYLIAKKIDVPLDNITIFFGNAHVYENNIEPTKELIAGNRDAKFNLNV